MIKFSSNIVINKLHYFFCCPLCVCGCVCVNVFFFCNGRCCIHVRDLLMAQLLFFNLTNKKKKVKIEREKTSKKTILRHALCLMCVFLLFNSLEKDAQSVNSISNSNKSPDNSNDSGGTVMEMVGAVVDNNYDVNSQLLNQYEQQQHLLQHDKAPLREEKNNLVMEEREQVPPMKHQMLPSSNEKLSEKKKAKKKLRKGIGGTKNNLILRSNNNSNKQTNTQLKNGNKNLLSFV